MESLLDDVKNMLDPATAAEDPLLAVLDRTLQHFQCQVGTIHLFNPESLLLELKAQRGIPDAILDRVAMIPIGKGMAGLAAERLEPVQVCNLQSDTTGQAKPAAKATGMEGSISFPMLVDDELIGTMGVAKVQAYEFNAEERELLMKVGEMVGRYCKRGT